MTQTNVPVETTAGAWGKDNRVVYDMDDRDIWVLRKDVSKYQGDEVTDNPTRLIASLEEYITNTTDVWTEQVYKFKYDPKYKNQTPAKMNIILQQVITLILVM